MAHVSDVVDPAVLKQVFASPMQIVLVVAVLLLPLPLVRLHHALALHRVRVGHQTPAADSGSSRQKSWDYTIHRRIDNNF